MTRYAWPPSPASDPDDSAGRGAHRAAVIGVLEGLDREGLRAERQRAERALAARRSSADLVFGAPTAPTADDPLWRSVGPTVVLNGQAGGRPRVTGRIRDIEVDPDGQRIYVGAGTAGVWYSSDGGGTWAPLGGWETAADPDNVLRHASAMATGCLLVHFGADPDGADDVVYVGTGELSGRRLGTPGSRMGGVGVLKLDGAVEDAVADPFADPWQREANNLTGFGIYRLARDPDGTPGAADERLVAATSAGLFTRSGAFTAEADWQRVEVDPFDFEAEDDRFTSDVVWAPAQAAGDGKPAVPKRLWVTLMARDDTSDTALYFSDNGIAGPFSKVALPGVQARFAARTAIGATPADRSVLYVVGSPEVVGRSPTSYGAPKLWRIDGGTAVRVDRIPDKLFGDTSDQSGYDMAIAVDPGDADKVMLGGSTYHVDNEWSASLFRFDISRPTPAGPYRTDFTPANANNATNDATYIGHGVHADVHQIRIVDRALGTDVWVACDGGLFRSQEGGDKHTFGPRHTGIASLECGYVRGHPTIENFVMAGTQDNGTLVRVGDTLWDRAQRDGDGGGVVIHRQRPARYIAQVTKGTWRSNDSVGFVRPVRRTSPNTASETTEAAGSRFYSGADIHPGTGNNDRVALGSTRLWISEDWDPTGGAQTWRTLPSHTDPRAAPSTDDTTDVFRGGPIVAVRWADAHRLVTLARKAVLWADQSAVNVFTRDPGSGRWSRDEISYHDGRTKSGGRFDNDDIDADEGSSFLPPLGSWSDIAVHQPRRGTRGSYYVATTGHVSVDDDELVESTDMDTLWWFDGTATWWPTGLRNDPDGTKAPAYAVAVDPDDDEIVYVGTALGVWRCELSPPTASDPEPVWSFGAFFNGLPEAAIEDLSIFRSGGTKLLRAAVRARGIWEVDLSATPVPPARTFLRVHQHDARRDLPSTLVDPTTSSGTDHDWGLSPDIRLRPSQLGNPPTAPTGRALPWTKATTSHPAFRPYDLWVLQLAMRFTDPLVEPDGRWTTDFGRRLRAYRTRFGQSDVERVDATTWTTANDILSSYHPPWRGTEATEADLHELIVEPASTGGPRRILVEKLRYAVDVLVHRFDVRPLPADDVNVLLLRRRIQPAQADGAGIPITNAWRNAVVDRLHEAASPRALPPGWQEADSTIAVRSPRSPLSSRTPRGVEFQVDWRGGARPRRSRWLLVAVVDTPGDPVSTAALAGGTVRELTLGSHHVAVKRVGVR